MPHKSLVQKCLLYMVFKAMRMPLQYVIISEYDFKVGAIFNFSIIVSTGSILLPSICVTLAPSFWAPYISFTLGYTHFILPALHFMCTNIRGQVNWVFIDLNAQVWEDGFWSGVGDSNEEGGFGAGQRVVEEGVTDTTFTFNFVIKEQTQAIATRN
jgi:hypothetical protein